ncbi:MAG: SDR family oxidoreductase [Nitrospirota bacterium]
MEKERSAIIISASSDIGTEMCHRWKSKGWRVYGTYRTKSKAADDLIKRGIDLVYCDLSNPQSVRDACSNLRKLSPAWDVLVLCPGMQDPVGPFMEDDFDEWENSIKVNFTSQLRIVHTLLPSRNVGQDSSPCVIFFAGGGTNDAPANYSAYILSKIALIKMTELLDSEIKDTRFVIIGPGWVKTKIHESTLKAGLRAGDNYQRTIEKLASDECTSMEKVLDCCDWLIGSPCELVSGRNFSVAFDMWGTEELAKRLAEDPNMYKLRRYGNDWIVKREKR